jgi:DNA polymerase-3 subunit gamma/tau
VFENLLYQDVAGFIRDDFRHGMLPNAMLFAGPRGSGKLTAALELTRALSCAHNAEWNCDCASCRSHKALVSPDVLLAGPRDCTLEIAAARQAFLIPQENAKEAVKDALHHLFMRSVRKLTLRFHPVLWADDDKLGKCAPLLAQIDEKLEELVNEHAGDLEKLTAVLLELCQKLESGFMYDSLPVLHVRNASSWAHYTQADGKKVCIIENAEQMMEGGRNALLKTLEEPPDDTVFILTTSKRSVLMPTILSRVRTYYFYERAPWQSAEIIKRLFHTNTGLPSIQDYLYSFLPVSPVVVERMGAEYCRDALLGKIPDIKKIDKEAGKFEPRILLTSFLNGIVGECALMRNAQVSSGMLGQVTVMEQMCMEKVRECYARISGYNLTPQAALEALAVDLGNIGVRFSAKDFA